MNWQAVKLLPLILILLGQSGPGMAQTSVDRLPGETVVLDGIVISKKKYSFTIATENRTRVIRLLPTTTIAARIIRPEIDWKASQIRGMIPASAEDGRRANNLKLDFPLPTPIFFRHRFDSQDEMEKVMEQPKIELEHLIFSRNRLENEIKDGGSPEWTGELKPTGETGSFETTMDGQTRIIRATWSTLIYEGFSMLDLVPLETDVFVNGEQVGNEIQAKRIEFIKRVNLEKIFSAPQPKCLVIGDNVSFNYFSSLIRELDGVANVYHPNTNCRGSANYQKILRWLGPNDAKYHWDVVAFNFGHHDSELDKSTYQSNLRECLKLLTPRTKKLIWIDSTPVPYGFNDDDLEHGQYLTEEQQFDFEFEELDPVGLKPGRMRLQNQWAAEVLKEYPQVTICPLWEVVKKDEVGQFKQWWYGKTVNFKVAQTSPLAKAIADRIQAALKN